MSSTVLWISIPAFGVGFAAERRNKIVASVAERFGETESKVGRTSCLCAEKYSACDSEEQCQPCEQSSDLSMCLPPWRHEL